MASYDAEELFWKNQHTEADAMKTVVWGATNLEAFNKNTAVESNFIVETLGITKEDVVLDYGVGLGRLAKPISDVCKHVVGLDVSNAMVGHSNKYLEGVENVNVMHCSSIGESPVGFNTIDKIYSYIVLQHINKYKVLYILKNLKRTLTPGGRGLFQFPDITKDKGVFVQYANAFVSNSDNTCSLHFWTKEEANHIFELAGWKVVEFIDWETDFWVIAE